MGALRLLGKDVAEMGHNSVFPLCPLFDAVEERLRLGGLGLVVADHVDAGRSGARHDESCLLQFF
jgi:hypothetical protein